MSNRYHSSMMSPWKRLDLKEVTLVLVSGIEKRKSLYALWRSGIGINFNSTIFVTDMELETRIKGITIESTQGFVLDSIDAYSKYCVYHLGTKIKSKYALLVQADGYIIHRHKWNANFLQYDYIGSPWKLSDSAYIDPFGNHQRVGNGGFSLRSKRLLDIPNSSPVQWEVNKGEFYKHMNVGSQAEDGIICVHNRHIYEAEGIQFAPLEIALKFGFENRVDEYQGKLTFGYHKHFPKIWERALDLFYRLIFLVRYPLL